MTQRKVRSSTLFQTRRQELQDIAEDQRLDGITRLIVGKRLNKKRALA